MRITPRTARETGREYALRTIKDNIIRLELAPGSFISENELASQLGLSRTPVREALIDLAGVKIVEIAPQKRTVVSYVNYDMVEEARFVRRVLETAVVELVCAMRTQEDLGRLEENVRLQRFYLERGNYGGIMELDDRFHQMLFDIAQKPQAFQMVQHMAIHFDRVRSMALSEVKDMNIVEDHGRIVEALARQDPAEAKALLGGHLDRYRFDETALRSQYPQYFGPEK